MKKLLTSVALLAALGSGSALVPVHAQGYWNETDIGLWDSDNWASDNYGAYDQDFNWGAIDTNEWDRWYGDSDSYWNDYDDIGDEGWFDV